MNPVKTHLYVGAGGGGDGLAALIVRHALHADTSRPVVASFSWDRYVLDPAPGPRSASDFDGLTTLTEHCWEVTPTSRLRSGGTSTLTLLAQHTDARSFLLDPHAGAAGLHQQLREIVVATAADAVTLVDVGGDVIARGDERTLRSPLADSLTLAALAQLPVPCKVIIAGPGLDGELPADLVQDRCRALAAEEAVLTSSYVHRYLPALRQHPSEATSLLAAAALGTYGRAEIRDSASLVPVTRESATLFAAEFDAVLSENRLAQCLVGSRTLTDADAITVQTCGRSELAYERRKAADAARRPAQEPSREELRERLGSYVAHAKTRGASLTTFRRVTEVVGLRRYDPTRIRRLIGGFAHPDLAIVHLDRERIGRSTVPAPSSPLPN